MKVRIFPKAEVIRNVLEERINQTKCLLDEEETALGKLTSNSSGLILPGNEYEIKGAQQAIRRHTEYLAERTAELTLLKSHAPSEVMAEFEV